ncbi:hypothetical protein FV219_11860, partial [Methylobacterium sp. WL122]
MLADGRESRPITEGLRIGLHQPATQLRTLVAFIAEALPFWRDDEMRPPETAYAFGEGRGCGPGGVSGGDLPWLGLGPIPGQEFVDTPGGMVG